LLQIESIEQTRIRHLFIFFDAHQPRTERGGAGLKTMTCIGQNDVSPDARNHGVACNPAWKTALRNN